MATKRILPKTATQYAVETIRAEVFNNTIKAGQRIKQDEIAKQLGISTTPVREALKQLCSEGLLISDAYKGCVAKGLCVEDLDEIYDLRILLEPKLIELSFFAFNKNSLDEIENIKTNMNSYKNIKEWIELDSIFHLYFWKSAENSRVFNIVENLKMQSLPYISLSLFYMPSHIEKSHKTHNDILQAYKQNNLSLAIELNEHHLNDTKTIIHKALQKST